MMRRPLCLLFLFLLVACSLYFSVFATRPADPYRDRDGDIITLTGTVLRKENRIDYSGAEVTDLYIRPKKSGSEVKVQIRQTESGFGMPETFEKNNGETKADETDRNRISDAKAMLGHSIGIGNTITVTGTVKCFARATNPGEFDSYEYYLTQKILFTLKNAEIISVTGKENRFREWLYLLRCTCSESFKRTLGASDAAVMRAMLLGDRSALDDNLKDLYRRNGIIHILAVSGLHISVLGLGFKKFLEKLHIPKKLTILLCILVMYSYGVMCGMSTSTYRAVVMFALSLAAPLVKRTYDMLSAVSLCGMMLLIEQPRYAVYSGFLMSFGAVCAIGFLLPLCKDIFFFIPGAVQKVLLPGVCVSFALLPVYMCCYYTFPVISLFLNPLILPLMSLLMPAGVLTIVFGMVSSGIGGICGLFCHWILVLYEMLCRNTGTMPGAVWYAGAPKVWQVAGFYIVLASVVWVSGKNKKERIGKKNRNTETDDDKGDGRKIKYEKEKCGKEKYEKEKYEKEKYEKEKYEKEKCGKEKYENEKHGKEKYEKEKYEKEKCGKEKYGTQTGWGNVNIIRNGNMLCVLLLTVAVLVLSYRKPVSFQVTFLDVGQGDCNVIRSGKNCYILDGGSSSKQNVGKNIILPYLKYEAVKAVDALILSHDDEDHISGIMELLDEMAQGGLACKQLILPNMAHEKKGEAYLQLEDRARMLRIPVTYLQSGEYWKSSQASFVCLSPSSEMSTADSNENSLVILAAHKNMQILFTGDTEGTGLECVKKHMEKTIERNTTEDFRKSADDGTLDQTLFAGNRISGRNENKGKEIHVADSNDGKSPVVRILKVAHHGSRNNTDRELLNLFTPHAAIISCGEKNRYGHPHKDTLDLLANTNARTCVTYKTGAVILGSDGENAVISTFLEP